MRNSVDKLFVTAGDEGRLITQRLPTTYSYFFALLQSFRRWNLWIALWLVSIIIWFILGICNAKGGNDLQWVSAVLCLIRSLQEVLQKSVLMQQYDRWTICLTYGITVTEPLANVLLRHLNVHSGGEVFFPPVRPRAAHTTAAMTKSRLPGNENYQCVFECARSYSMSSPCVPGAC